MSNQEKILPDINCSICGKSVESKHTGNPKIYHLKCAMEASKESREYVQNFTKGEKKCN